MANFKQTSRYREAVVTKNRSNQNFIILRNPIKLKPGAGDTFITITQELLQRPDLVSYAAYGNAAYWWIIYEFNGIRDPIFGLKLNDILRVPPIEEVLSVIASLGE